MANRYCNGDDHEWENSHCNNNVRVQGKKYVEVIVDSCTICEALLQQCFSEPMQDDHDFDPDVTFIYSRDGKRRID